MIMQLPTQTDPRQNVRSDDGNGKEKGAKRAKYLPSLSCSKVVAYLESHPTERYHRGKKKGKEAKVRHRMKEGRLWPEDGSKDKRTYWGEAEGNWW